MSDTAGYLLSKAPNDQERLRAWAEVWEASADAMLDQIGVQSGWHCIDLGCGPRGILKGLSHRAGAAGRVVGLDINPAMLASARTFAEANGIHNVEFVAGNVYQTGLPRGEFDLVHARFILAPLGKDDDLIDEMLALARPGGMIALEEPDESSYACYPRHAAWERLKEITIAGFARGGGDYNAGRRIYSLLRRSGLVDVQARAAVLALPGGHPYRLWPVESAVAMRPRLLEWNLVTEAEFDDMIQSCEQIARDPENFITSFMVVQVWGRKPLEQ